MRAAGGLGTPQGPAGGLPRHARGISYASDPRDRVTGGQRNVTAASGGTSTGKGEHVLSDRSRPVIEATLPVVADHIQEIAQRFYAHLFQAHPELNDGVFNRGNQSEGTQQVALAGSVAVFASALVKTPEQLPETRSEE